MSQQSIVTTPVNSGLGDPAYSAFNKCNENFSELYGATSAVLFEGDGSGASFSDAALTDAIGAASALNPAKIVVPVGIYKFASAATYTLPNGVQLVGAVRGPFDGYGVNPATTLWAPTFLVENSSTSFLTLDGWGAALENVLFYHPGQVSPSASTPTVYPPTVTVTNGKGGWKILGCTFANSYDAINCQSGRGFIQGNYIGGLHTDIIMDNIEDWVFVGDNLCGVFWDIFAGVADPSTLDAWVLSNSTSLHTYRVDGLKVVNHSAFMRYEGHTATDSSIGGLNPTCGYGTLVNCDFDTVAYGIACSASNVSGGGFKYVNCDIGANGTGVGTPGQAVVETIAGGSQNPLITIIGGSIRGTWAAGAPHTVNNAGSIYIEQMRGINPFGAFTAPAVPLTTVAQVNAYPFPVRVFVFASGASISSITINSTGIGNQILGFTLMPGDTVTLNYTGGPPTWNWFGE